MAIPLNQAARIGAYVVKQHLLGRKRYPLVLMLEPLFRCKMLQAWEGQLAIAIATSFGCYAYACSVPRPGRGTQIEIVGRTSDVELVRYLFTWIRGELMRICERDHKAAETKFKKADWYQGAALGVYEQMQRGRQVARAEAHATTAALARIDARSAEAEAFAEALGNVPKVSRPEPTDAAAYYRGREAGLNVHLGDKLSEGTTQTRLSQTNDRH